MELRSIPHNAESVVWEEAFVKSCFCSQNVLPAKRLCLQENVLMKQASEQTCLRKPLCAYLCVQVCMHARVCIELAGEDGEHS